LTDALNASYFIRRLNPRSPNYQPYDPKRSLRPTTLRPYTALFCSDWPAHTTGQTLFLHRSIQPFHTDLLESAESPGFRRFHNGTVFFTTSAPT
jgi:hypothetical protein